MKLKLLQLGLKVLYLIGKQCCILVETMHMHSVKIICLLILFALVAVFTFQNTNVAEIKFLLWSASLSISLMLLSALFAGIIIGLLLSFLNTRSKLKKEKKESSPIF